MLEAPIINQLYDEPTSFRTEMYLSQAKTATVCLFTLLLLVEGAGRHPAGTSGRTFWSGSAGRVLLSSQIDYNKPFTLHTWGYFFFIFDNVALTLKDLA